MEGGLRSFGFFEKLWLFIEIHLDPTLPKKPPKISFTPKQHGIDLPLLRQQIKTSFSNARSDAEMLI
jgi:hypothetical protein